MSPADRRSWLRTRLKLRMGQSTGTESRVYGTRRQDAAGFGIKAVGELGLDARALIQEGKGPSGCRQSIGQPGAVFLGLRLDAGQSESDGLGFHHSDRFLVHIEKVIDGAVSRLEGKLAHRNPGTGVEVDRVGVLNYPTGQLK